MLRVTRQPCLRIILKSKRMHRAVLQKQFCILSPEVRGLRQWVFTSKLNLAFNVRSCSTQQQPKRESSKRNEVPEGESEIEETRKDTSGLKVRPVEVKTARVPLSRYAATFEKAVALEATKENFYDVVDTFAAKDRTRRGHMEFLKTATEYMEQFNVEKDLTAYNKLLDVFPRGRFKNRTLFDAIWAKQHPQSELALEILTKMEENVLKPSIDTHDILLEVFGHASQPVQKCRRLAYWLTKLEEMFPHPLPQQLPDNEVELSRLAFDRMTKQQMDVVVYQVGSSQFPPPPPPPCEPHPSNVIPSSFRPWNRCYTYVVIQ